MGFATRTHVSYGLDDLTDLDQIFNHFANIVKENIKHVDKKLTIKEIDDIEILLKLLDKTFSRQNMQKWMRLKREDIMNLIFWLYLRTGILVQIKIKS